MSKAITEDRAQKRGIRIDRLRDQLKGDLEAIVSNSLTANPKDRYRNVSDLGDDRERFLSHRPILAQRQTTICKFKTYLVRYRGALTASALIVVALLSLAGYGYWQ